MTNKAIQKEEDPIAPSYYTQYQIQPIDFIRANKLDFFQANILKYICRWKSKGGIEDLRKAREYLNMYIQDAVKT